MGDYQKKIDKAVVKRKAEPLLRMAQSKDKNMRVAALRGLGKVGDEAGFNLLITTLHDRDADLRAAAADALGEMQNAHAKAHMLHYLETETDARVREAMTQAVSSIVER